MQGQQQLDQYLPSIVDNQKTVSVVGEMLGAGSLPFTFHFSRTRSVSDVVLKTQTLQLLHLIASSLQSSDQAMVANEVA